MHLEYQHWSLQLLLISLLLISNRMDDVRQNIKTVVCAVTNIHHICFHQSTLIPLLPYIRAHSLSYFLHNLHCESLDLHLFRWASRWADVDPKKTPQSSLSAQPQLERAYEELALWLLDLATCPWTNGKPENESRFRPGTRRHINDSGRENVVMWT